MEQKTEESKVPSSEAATTEQQMSPEAPAEAQPQTEDYAYLGQPVPAVDEENKDVPVEGGPNADNEQNAAGENKEGTAEEPITSDQVAPPAESQGFQAAFDEINTEVDELDSTLGSSLQNYSKAKGTVGADLIRLCTHYVLGNSGSPGKTQEAAGMFGSNKVSPIKKSLDTGSPSPQYMDQQDLGQDNVDEPNELGRELDEERPAESSQRYNAGVLSKNFYQRDTKMSYKKYEEPAGFASKYPTYSEPQRAPYPTSGSAKPTAAYHYKY